jgi:flagellar basal-body rod protein FlgF/flagellar basal-body rod protein FlgG
MLLRLKNSYASMAQLAQHQERTANNLANVNTIGYKQERVFITALNERLDAEGSPVSDRSVIAYADQAQGNLEPTGNKLDVALTGEGFFVLNDARSGEPRYTRAGRFTIDPEGTLRDAYGHEVQGESGPIQFPSEGGDIEITRDGEIRLNEQPIDRLSIVRFEDPTQLMHLDASAFTAGDLTPLPADNPDVRQGYIEGSNVNALREMSDMIEHFHLFDSQQRSIRTTDQILAGVVRDLSRF